ncbi:MFS general substrate transporter [Aaosphaeria arxii CBS 175.79]|uniref:MFS general substrate transporter n=1 Tax=Aaosphaeria arxii CBS 175.79 TaxID=1450172 RepID=A0A6A5XPZ0_9PLEO|nr:MFS general substrate transporter [Aaosphaeria arxii CBS 175.79]KAF2015335.1 MFS general substrate transporter [Aaosphaeria arxii CBS 175.79]
MAPSRSQRGSVSTIKTSADEETPLLTPIAPVPTFSEPIEAAPDLNTSIHDDEDENAPLPTVQIFLLCYTRVVEPIAFFSIFPYINTMIERVGGVATVDVGFYSGLIESLFSVTQMCVMIAWGKAADRWGRKPCLVLSLVGISISMALFGMSQTIWQMILFRCIAGVFSGTLVTVRAMITENSTKKTQAKAFSYFAFSGNVGIFLGPMLGAALERPALKYPIFSNIKFFQEYPYALPGFVTSIIGATAAILSALFVRETLHLHHRKGHTPEPTMSTMELLRHPGIGRVLFIYNYILALAFAFTAANPVFLYTPIDLGGIGFSPSFIGGAIAVNGVSQALWLLFAFPPLHRRTGTIGTLRLCALMWPIFFLINPLANLLLRTHHPLLFWTLSPPVVVIGSGVAMAFTAMQLAINDIAPSHHTLGTLNAVALAMSSGLRAVVPALGASLYAAGVKGRVLEGQLFWVVITALAVGLWPVLKWLPEKAWGRIGHRVQGVGCAARY